MAGDDGVRTILFSQGRQWYQRADDAERIPLIPVSPTEFAMGEGQRFQFVSPAAGMEMRLLNTDGTQVAFPRHQ